MEAYIAPLLFLGLSIYMTVVCVQKGKPWFAGLGWVFGWFLIFGSIRLAKPDSRWAQKHYSGETMRRSEERFSS